MARRADTATVRPGAPVLVVEHLDVHYGRAHVLQGVSLTLERGVLAIVGRNGMGKTTLCNALTGLVASSGSVEAARRGDRGLPRTASPGAASLTCRGAARLALAQRRRDLAWSRRPARGRAHYAMFPRLAERKDHGGARASGGEAQMLAIGRALLLAPKLLVMTNRPRASRR
jgi:ABC-type branched-subunit amino acid transport system ATPase component